jgi:hypothetical protein
MYVNLGKVMLQRHQLLAAFDADKEKYAPFEDILRAAQVSSQYAALSYRQLKTSSHSNSPLSCRKRLCFLPGLHLLSGLGLVSDYSRVNVSWLLRS